MASYAMVNNQTNFVDNAVEWDGEAFWTPLEGYTVVKFPEPNETEPTPGRGWWYINGVFVETLETSSPPQDAPNVIAE